MIHNDKMGEVWPAVQPGTGPNDLGSARLVAPDTCTVRSYQTLTVRYTAGRFGLDDTGGIMIAMRWVSDGGLLQTDDPSAMNYVTAESSTGVPLELFVEPYGYRPWTLALRITVKGGYLRPGESIDILLGDRTGGGPGMRMQTIAEAAQEFRISVDACATGQFSEITERLSVPVIAGPGEIWRVVGPGLRRPNQTFAIGVRLEDSWGNPAKVSERGLTLEGDGIEGLPTALSFDGITNTARVDGLSATRPGPHHVQLKDGAGTIIAISNPIFIQDGELAGYWGDLHGQSGETVGIGTIQEYMTFAKDIAFLDVCGHQANDFQIKNAFWDQINDVTTEMDEDGRFTVFPGYEWSGNTPVGGDHNVFFRHAGRQIRRSSHAMLDDRSDLATDALTLDALFEDLSGEDAILWSHIGGRPADVSYAHDPKLKTAVEVHSNWGTFEWVLTDSLALGHRVGVVANSDGHKGRPGAGPPGATEFGAYGGLTCFLAPELTRDAIFECMRRRHHYGTSGSRIHLEVKAEFERPAQVYPRDPHWSDVPPQTTDAAIMGDIVQAEGVFALSIRVEAPAGIERMDLMDGAKLLDSFRPYHGGDVGRRLRIYWQGAEYRGRGRNTFWAGQIRTNGSPIIQMTPVNQWNPERPLGQTGPDEVGFEAVTSGNFAGVDLLLGSDDAVLDIETNLTAGRIVLGDLGLEDHRLDAGGLDRAILIRRLPEASLPESYSARLAMAARPGSALWVRITTTDGHQAWSSPLYLI